MEWCDMMWVLYDNGVSIGTSGSENGIIIKDEEHTAGARITLEQGGYAPYGITCGIYGLMCHTAFASLLDEAAKKYEAMKLEISKALSSDAVDLDTWCDNFTNRF